MLVATGLFAGFCAGLLGIGGGAIMVPAFLFLFAALGVPPAVLAQAAVGTSLACISVIAINSTRAHHRRGAVLWPVMLRLAPGLVAGALVGAAVAHLLSSLALQRVVGVAALLLALRMALDLDSSGQRPLPGAAALAGVGTAIGGLSALVGIGGGALTVPFLSWCRVPMVRAVGTSAACGMPIAWAGTLGFVVAGWGAPAGGLGYVQPLAAAVVVAASLAATPLGAALAHRLPANALRRVFALLLTAVGLRLLYGLSG